MPTPTPAAFPYPLRKKVAFSAGNLLGGYFFNSYRRTILASSGVLLGILLLGQIIYSLPAIIATGFNPLMLLKIIVCYSPQALTIILPLVASFGVFVAMRRQFENHELLMARGFGIAEKQLLRIVQKLGLIGFVVLLVLKSYFAPWGQAGYRDVKFAATQNIARSMVEEGRFFSPNYGSSGFTIFIGKKNFNGALSDIFIFDNRNLGHVSAISAQKGAMTNNNILTLDNGIEFKVGGPRVTSLGFERYSMDVSVFQQKKQRRSVNEIDSNVFIKMLLVVQEDKNEYYYAWLILAERVVYSLLGFFFPLFAAVILWRSKVDKSGRYFGSLSLLFCLTIAFVIIHLVTYNYARDHLGHWYIMFVPAGLLLTTFLLLRYWPARRGRQDRPDDAPRVMAAPLN
ncbi:MAG: LptF/LptG family permease [Hydrotalea sp.]|nr:LptF/LptG family permease [Hydrotalea sp.]